MNVIPFYKEIGETPLDAIGRLKAFDPSLSHVKISYAGRLDPMAEGILLLLVGEENKKRKDYENLEKIYVAEIALGVRTDSYDALGLAIGELIDRVPSEQEIEGVLLKFQGEIVQNYPPFSSKPVKGRPLYWWAREGKIGQIEIPSKKVIIKSIKKLSIQEIQVQELVEGMLKRIRKVKGNFRQEQIIKKWRKVERLHEDEKLYILKIEVSCSSGTYIREIAHQIGRELSIGAFALSIKRIQIGPYTSQDCVEIG